MTSWVILDETGGSTASNGEGLTASSLAAIAEACTVQLNRDYAPECGGPSVSVRAGSSATDIQTGELVFAILAALPDAPGDIAYHSVDGNGVAFSLLAITMCSSVLGLGASVSSAVSHEILETAGDEGCNRWADDGRGTEHAIERCDAVEVQSYAVTTHDGVVVLVSSFVLDSWLIPGAPGPYSYMGKAGLPGAIDPPGPMQTAESGGGNYQAERPSPTSEHQVFAARSNRARIAGTPRNVAKSTHWSSRAYRRGVRS